ncbi:MAG: TMEM165/GDT1 family protein [Proteobacteria bacterium]|jgi:putative Ca2+/H+ antiporter (TMEM165/GDT1 family)|nr:TMEM165/GDT1 family protein [Pseudomonadota bacterium]
MEAFLVSAGVVALAEIGDKTQLVALVLAARFRRPLPVIAAIAAATLVNHAIAGIVGTWLASVLGPAALRWILGLSFLALAAWLLVPDKVDPARATRGHAGVFATTLVTFFLAEMGDKTQIATVALAARFHDLYAVVGGTTAGMLLADVPAVLFGERIARRVHPRAVHAAAAVIYLAMGVLAIVGGEIAGIG